MSGWWSDSMRRGLLVALLTALLACRLSAQSPPGVLKVFPGAQGFGTETVAGRGGQVLKVTNLNDSGPGSLRAAVAASGPRIVVFEVSGTIRLQSELAIVNPYITIAGQTAPAPGIMLRDRRLRVGTHDVLIQHIASRPGAVPSGNAEEQDDRDSLTLQDYTNDIYNVVVDHCSFSWAVDEGIGIWGYSNRRLSDVTISNSIVSEALYQSINSFGPEGMGVLVGDYAKRVAVIGNLIASNRDRNGPLFKGGTSGMVVNNFVYNAGLSYRLGFSDDYNAGASLVAAVGNVYHDGPAFATNGPVWFSSNVKSGTQLYLNDNQCLRVNGTACGVRMIDAYPTWGDPQVSAAPVWSADVVPASSGSVQARVLATAGKRPGERYLGLGDPVDERIVSEVKNRTGSIKNTVEEAGGWPVMAARTQTFTVPNNPSDDDDGDGYTNIEELLHQLANAVEGKGRSALSPL